MYRGRRIAVVVPAYNVEGLIGRVVARMPAMVDQVVVVDDGSRDGTGAAAAAVERRGLVVMRHEENRGVGGAIVAGYRRAIHDGADIAAVMAGDAQMDPADLPRLLDPVVDGEVEYAKGNRFAHPDCFRVMPLVRFVGNRCLTWLTRAVAGFWHVSDSQCGYTAASRRCLEALELDRLWPRYGFPNDLLAHLKSGGFRVTDVTVRPIYDGEPSGIRPVRAVFSLTFVLARALLYRAEAAVRRAWGRRLGAAPAGRPGSVRQIQQVRSGTD